MGKAKALIFREFTMNKLLKKVVFVVVVFAVYLEFQVPCISFSIPNVVYNLFA
jgi:hypothetical protein